MQEEKKMGSSHKIHIFVNRRKIEIDSAELTGEQILAKAGFVGKEWDLFRLQGEGDPTGGTLVMWDQVITVKNGEHFRVIPGNRTFGA